MHEEILINITPQETRVAIVQQSEVQELHIERSLSLGHVSNIYLGKVMRVLPGIQSAFIDIGLERAAFLHIANVWQPRLPDQPDESEPSLEAPPPLIEEIIFEGQTLMVQIIKDPMGTKGARLSTQISIAGRTLVYLPQERSRLGISQKIEGETERESLRARLAAVLPADEEGGYIVRTIAENSTDDELANDVIYLRKTWATIRSQMQYSREALSSQTEEMAFLQKPADLRWEAMQIPRPDRSNRTASAARRNRNPMLLYRDLNLAQRVLRDFVNNNTQQIRVDSYQTFEQLIGFADEFMPAVKTKLHYYADNRSIFDLYEIENEIHHALEKRVTLKSGGYLIIDQTEAMTTIDVNTGGYVGTRNFDETIFKTNLEAAHSIARQLRLRNLGGIIIVDFIDMENAEHRDIVLTEFKKALSSDRARISVSDFSALGLVEMTRKRTRESLAHLLCDTCAACGGKGLMKTPRTLCYEALREILRESKQFSPREFRIIASQAVIDLFLEEESQHLAMLCDLLGKPISLQVDTQMKVEQYEIVLN